MSSRQAGNRFENLVAAEAEALGYATFAARGSRGPVDLICFEDAHRFPESEARDVPHAVPLVIQVGGRDKGSARVLEELEEAPRPIGSLCIVSKHLRQKNGRIRWAHHTREGKFLTLGEAINGEHLVREVAPKATKGNRRSGAGAKKAAKPRPRAARAARSSG